MCVWPLTLECAITTFRSIKVDLDGCRNGVHILLSKLVFGKDGLVDSSPYIACLIRAAILYSMYLRIFTTAN